MKNFLFKKILSKNVWQRGIEGVYKIKNSKKLKMYEIEKNVPVLIKGKKGYEKATKLRVLLNKMEVGDSMLIPKKDFFHSHNAKKPLLDAHFISRKVDETTLRIYRTK